MSAVAEPLNVVMVALGTYGDVHPFVGLGQAMRRRGHRVRVIANPFFSSLISQAGLQFTPVGSEEELRQTISDANLWHARHGLKTALQTGTRHLLPVYQAIADANEPGSTVVAYSSLAIGARLAQERFGIPSVAVHLAPVLFRSLVRPPVMPGKPIPSWAPRLVWRCVYKLSGIRFAWTVGPALQAARAQAGLPPLDIRQWNFGSPDGQIALFPAWFAQPQPDWPRNLRLTGFPMFDERAIRPLDEELSAFLDAGEAPIAFTPGSGMWNGAAFFAEAVRLCLLAGRRGLLLSSHTDHIPRNLPPTVRHVHYAPFSELLPRCAAVVHHGGIGTSAQAMAAGVPQLLTPFAHDQPDNAARLCALGVARTIPAPRFRAERAIGLLTQLLESPQVAAACRTVAKRFPDANAMERTCAIIEEIGSRPSRQTASRPANNSETSLSSALAS